MSTTDDIPIDLPEPTPPDFPQNDEKNNENLMPESMKKHTKTQAEKSVAITPQNDLPTLKTPVEIDDVDKNALPSSLLFQRTIEVASAVVIINNIITTPVTLQIRPKVGKAALKSLKFIEISSMQ